MSPEYALEQHLRRSSSTLAEQQAAEAAKAQEIRNKAKTIMDDFPGEDRASKKIRVVRGLLVFGALSEAFAYRHLCIYERPGYNKVIRSLKAIGDVLIDDGLPVHLFKEKGNTGREEWCLARDEIDQVECARVLAQFRELC